MAMIRNWVVAILRFVFYRERSRLPVELTPGVSVTLSPSVNFGFGVLNKFYEFNSSSLLIIGANNGDELNKADYASFKRVIAIEPNPQHSHTLNLNLKDFESHQVFCTAVGEKPGKALLNVASNNGESSSLLTPKRHLLEAPQVRFLNQIEVDVTRIDALIDEVSTPTVWMMDIQGFELEGLKGAGNRLNRVEVLYIEVNRDEVYKGCAQIEEIDSYLRQFALSRVLTRWWGSWGDAVYIRGAVQRKVSG